MTRTIIEGEKAVRAAVEMFQLIKEEKRRAFPERSYFKLKEEHPEGILKFDNDEEIEVERADIIDIIFDRKLKFAEHPHEI